MEEDANKICAWFKQITGVEDIQISYQIVYRGHHPSPLPDGKMAVYSFISIYRCLIIGKVAPKSISRFYSHHYYNSSTSSSLAKQFYGIFITHKNLRKKWQIGSNC